MIENRHYVRHFTSTEPLPDIMSLCATSGKTRHNMKQIAKPHNNPHLLRYRVFFDENMCDI